MNYTLGLGHKTYCKACVVVVVVLSLLVSPSNASLRGSRSLQDLWNPLYEFIFPWVQPHQYLLQPVEAFNLYGVCTDIRREGCTAANVIKFTTNMNSGPTEFRYQNTGPAQLQGVFWAQMDLLDIFLAPTDLISFAPTRHGGGVQTGVLQPDENGYVYVVRPIGDHTWSRRENDPWFYLTFFDVLYLFDLKEGTLANPTKFSIIPSFKLFTPCFRLNFGRYLTSNPSDPYVQLYGESSVVWNRKTTWMGLFTLSYPAIQVVDGNGQPIEPAFSAWQSKTPTNFIIGLNEDRAGERLQC